MLGRDSSFADVSKGVEAGGVAAGEKCFEFGVLRVGVSGLLGLRGGGGLEGLRSGG